MNSYDVFAIKYSASVVPRSTSFLMGDHFGGSLSPFFYVWIIQRPGRVVLVDTGFGKDVSERRGVPLERDVSDALTRMGYQPDQISDVIVTHGHFDHIGCLGYFPRARIHMQRREFEFVTGPYMSIDYTALGAMVEFDDVTRLLRLNLDQQLVLYDGYSEFEPGLELHPTPGHTPGAQSVRINTERGWVVLASDAIHFYENSQQQRPYHLVIDVGATLQSYKKIYALASSERHVIPGHDAAVLKQYRIVENVNGVEAVALHLDRVCDI